MKKNFILCTLAIMIASVAGCGCTKTTEGRDYAYEAYCDSIWNANPDYYMDVLMETNEYIQYVEKYGEWWED